MPWGRMLYRYSGTEGVPVVFLHGSGCDLTDWRGVRAGLPKSLRQVRLDFRGHGDSDVPDRPFSIEELSQDVLDLAEFLQLERMLVIGHSLGGMVAIDLAARSDLVCGLVLVEGWSQLTASRAFGSDRFYGNLGERAVFRIQGRSAETQAHFPPGNWERFWDTVQAFNGVPYLSEASIPVHEVYGEMGRADETESRLLIPDNPNISLHWIANAGHYLPQEVPEAVAEVLLAAIGVGP